MYNRKYLRMRRLGFDLNLSGLLQSHLGGNRSEDGIDKGRTKDNGSDLIGVLRDSSAGYDYKSQSHTGLRHQCGAKILVDLILLMGELSSGPGANHLADDTEHYIENADDTDFREGRELKACAGDNKEDHVDGRGKGIGHLYQIIDLIIDVDQNTAQCHTCHQRGTVQHFGEPVAEEDREEDDA